MLPLLKVASFLNGWCFEVGNVQFTRLVVRILVFPQKVGNFWGRWQLQYYSPPDMVKKIISKKASVAMALTASTMLALGTKAPDFQLPDVVSGDTISLATFADKKVLLIMFVCQHCPFVKHIKVELARLGKDYQDKSVGIVAISANDVANYPDDAPDKLKAMALELDFTFPFCYDETQETAKAYTAACTPDFFLFDADRKLVYRGQLDDSRPSNSIPVTGKDLRSAIDSVLADRSVSEEQKPSIGCNIKWKPGHF